MKLKTASSDKNKNIHLFVVMSKFMFMIMTIGSGTLYHLLMMLVQ